MAVGEWDQRQLCPDGRCVGVIGPDGTCKVCGRVAQNWGDERKRGLIEPEDSEDSNDSDDADDAEHDDLAASEEGEEGDEGDDDEDGDEDEDDDDQGEDPVAPHQVSAAASPPGDWSSRQLCPEGSCIGVIGTDGTCKVCGRRASPDKPISADEPAAASVAKPTSADEPAAASVTKPTSTDEPAPDRQLDEPASDRQLGDPASDRKLGDPASDRKLGEPASDHTPGEPAGDAASAGDTALRARCSDATCPGVSGPDGHCEVCGKSVAS
jgi:hypothetical protein